jgi:hypothetical protein
MEKDKKSQGARKFIPFAVTLGSLAVIAIVLFLVGLATGISIIWYIATTLLAILVPVAFVSLIIILVVSVRIAQKNAKR